jgi:hypothetical protein
MSSIKTGDLEPPWQVAISDGAQAADLTTVESWRFVARQGSAVLFTDTNPTVVVDGTNTYEATVTHDWVAGETDVAGRVDAEIVAVWPGAREQTFPSSGRVQLTIEPSID